MRRFLRRGALTLVGVFVLLTAASLLFNAVTVPPDRTPAAEGQDLSVGGMTVHVRIWGGGGTPIVLLPGFAESTGSFDLAAPLIAAQGHTVVAIDLPGLGYTRGGDRTDLRSQVDMVAGVITALHLDHPVVLGHSMGAAVAGGVALWHPALVRGVIFADGDAQDLDLGSSGVRSLILRSPYATSLYRIATRWTWADQQVLAASCGSACTAYDGEAGYRRAAARMAPLRQGDAERSLLGGMSQGGILHLSEAQTRAISVPRGIIWGAEDERSGGSLADTRDRLGHPAERIIPGAGHDVMSAAPQAFADAVTALAAGF